MFYSNMTSLVELRLPNWNGIELYFFRNNCVDKDELRIYLCSLTSGSDIEFAFNGLEDYETPCFKVKGTKFAEQICDSDPNCAPLDEKGGCR